MKVVKAKYMDFVGKEARHLMSPEKSLSLSINMDDLVSLVGHQRKRHNHSRTFNALNHDNYSLALNSHQDNVNYTLKKNHLQLYKRIYL